MDIPFVVLLFLQPSSCCGCWSLTFTRFSPLWRKAFPVSYQGDNCGQCQLTEFGTPILHMRNVDAWKRTSTALNDKPLAVPCGKTLSSGQDLSKPFCPGQLSAEHREKESQHKATKFPSYPHHSVGHAGMCENVFITPGVYSGCVVHYQLPSLPQHFCIPIARLCTPPKVVVY